MDNGTKCRFERKNPQTAQRVRQPVLPAVMKQQVSRRLALMRERHIAQCLRSQATVTTLWRAAAMMMSELADSAYLSQHGLFIVLVSALAMQLIVIFCNLQQQPN